jgi:hypothetical protein
MTLNWWQALASRKPGRNKSARCQTAAKMRTVSLLKLESLEDRTLLSSTSLVPPALVGPLTASTTSGASQPVKLAATATALTTSAAQPVVGQNVTFTATVTDQVKGRPKPTGQVTFMDGATVLKTMALDATGKAVYSTAFTTTGGHTIKARYLGDAQTAASSATVTEQVAQAARAATKTTLAASPAQATVGQSVTFTATVADQTKGGPIPTGQVAFMEGANVLKSVALDATGKATFAMVFTTAGGHSITARYLGDTHANPSSASVVEHVTGAVRVATTTTLTASPVQGVLVGQDVVFTATVTDPTKGGPVPTGQVAFMEGTSVLKTVPLDATGKATFSMAFATAGNHIITAKYLGDAHTAVSSATVTEQVARDTRAATTTTLAASPAQAAVGQSVTFTATVSDQTKGGPVPTGQLRFTIDGVQAKVVSLDAKGNAALSTTFATAGGHVVSARYLGDAHTAISSASVTEQVTHDTRVATTTALTTSVAQPGVGQDVTFTATVTDSTKGGPAPTGMVAFMEGATVLKTVALDATGKATFTMAFTTAGTHTITAKYLGDSHTAVSSASVTEQVQQATRLATATTLAASPSQTTVGQSVTFTATVTDQGKGGPTPTGMVAFMEGTTVLKTVALDATGKAVYTMAFTTAGSHTIVARYQGDSKTLPSTASAVEKVAADTRAATTTTLTADLVQAFVGQTVNFTATVTDPTKGGPAPTGQIAFMTANTILKTVSLDAKGQAVYTTSFASAGTQSITANYLGDAKTQPSSATTTEQVTKDTRVATTTSVAASVPQATVGENVTFTATVTDPTKGGPAPTGQVTFMDGTTVLKTVSLDAKGTAAYTTAFTTAGSHTITANYLGDAKTQPSSGTATEQVAADTRAATTTSLTASAPQATVGENVTFTATVTDSTKGGPAPTGQVAFMDGTTVLKTVALDASGTAVYTTAFTTAGSHTITANYLGDTKTQPSSATATEQVTADTRVATTTMLAAAPEQATTGQDVAFTATVTDPTKGGPAPTGMVAFSNGTTVLKTLALDANGTAVYTTSFLTPGSYTITANYLGDAKTAPSSATATEQVTPSITTAAVTAPVTQTTLAATKTSLAASASQANVGQNVTFTATVTDPTKGGPKPTGKVTFTDGNTTLKTVSLDGSGKAVYTTAFAAAGSHTITAKYLGDTKTAASSATVKEQVNKETRVATTTSLVASTAQATVGQSITFTATVTDPTKGGPKPTGQVAFMDGTNILKTVSLDATGKATFTTSFTTGGSHTITAKYLGDTKTAASSATVNEVVTQDKRLATLTAWTSVNPSAVINQNVIFTVKVTPAAAGTAKPGGKVTFMEGNTVLGTVTIDNTGQATLTYAFKQPGQHSVIAQYAGDNQFAPSVSKAIVQVVAASHSVTILETSAATVAPGQNVTFTATVKNLTPGAASPTGKITFLDGSTVLKTVALDAGGNAMLTTTFTTVGKHKITANYSGDSHSEASTMFLNEQVGPIPAGK